jgi:RNA-binding protein
MSLNNKQIRFLRAQAHSMKPVVLIGSAGLTDNVINEINQALDDHELIKVRVNAEDRDKKSKMIDSIIRQTECIHIQTIGHIGIFYRQNKKNPVIEFPKT